MGGKESAVDFAMLLLPLLLVAGGGNGGGGGGSSSVGGCGGGDGGGGGGCEVVMVCNVAYGQIECFVCVLCVVSRAAFQECCLHSRL